MSVLEEYAGYDGFDNYTLFILVIRVWLSDKMFEVLNP